jgi:hypothetical protein
MGHPALKRTELEALKQYATENELRWLNACIRHGGARAAAKAIGGKASLCFSALRTVRKRAARRGFAPEFGWNPPAERTEPAGSLPEGFELEKRTDNIGANGERLQTWNKARQERAPAQVLPDGFLPRRITQATAGGREVMQWTSYAPDEARRIAATLAAWERHAALYAGLAGTVPGPDARGLDEDLIAVLPIGDPHIGLLAWAPESGAHQDTTIVCRELLACVKQAVHDLPACPTIIIGNLGDALHAQDDGNKTPGHGNQLDVDGRYAKVLDAAHVVFRGIVEEALRKYAKVIFRNLPGNHDPRVAVEMMMWLRAWFRDEPRLELPDAYAAHQYDRFGKVLLGWHHGDRTRKGELPAIMASDHDGGGTGWWGETTEHVWHVGHEHHTTVLETPSCLVHVHNTIVGKDAYHAGRYRAKRMIEGYAYHKRYGLHSSHTVSLARVLAACDITSEGSP